MSSEGTAILHSSLEIAELIRACADSDEAAWREFVGRFQKPISVSIIRVARRWGALPRECVDDLVQDTYLKLCADKCSRLYQFSLAHPEAVDAYVKTIAVNVANDFFKAHRSIKRGGGEVVQLLDTIEPKAPQASFGAADSMQRELLLREIDQCLQDCAEVPGKKRDRLIFWLHYQQGMSANAISALPAMGLTVKGVESVLHRLTGLVRGQIANSPSTERATSESGPKGLGPANS